ncbi:hypothetical protein Mevan_0092 [Methanococcus vannielii SB]|uniref:Exocyst complex component EXOC6/Sec15 N-terminal domain-containing protein n=1 Tax=Methanococcus vannielii (strain ATCC 35089 / DSM 1224 / JCM 13029 / OCM 148 / SB) TaxID=406327 RepID=A6UND4_METVS|nr:hypothetical protein [Methanococcus vannielii]ABR54006.1 hypothetical protein Mevan_0092 [Methanococcus vannielii SB]
MVIGDMEYMVEISALIFKYLIMFLISVYILNISSHFIKLRFFGSKLNEQIKLLNEGSEKIENLNEQYLENIKIIDKKLDFVNEFKENIDGGLKRIKNLMDNFQNDVKDDFEEGISNLNNSVDELNKISETEDELRKEIQKNKNELNKLEKSIVEFLKSKYAVLDLDSTDKAINNTNREINQFIKILRTNGVKFEVIMPNKGDEFDNINHTAVGEKECKDVENGKIISCETIGYIYGEFIEKSRVILCKNEIQKQNNSEESLNDDSKNSEQKDEKIQTSNENNELGENLEKIINEETNL